MQHLGAFQSTVVTAPAAQSPVASANAIATNSTVAGPLWWRLVSAEIDEAPEPGAVAKPNYFTTHPIDLMIPAGWKLVGRVDWPMHQGNPTLAFHVDSPDGQIGLEYLGSDSWSWSKDAATRAQLKASGRRVGPLPATLAADYLRKVLLAKLRPGAQVISVEPLPKPTAYITEQLSGENIAATTGAEQTGTAVAKSTGDAARARISYVRNGVAVDEWIEIAVEHLQQHADSTPPWRPGEKGRLTVAPSGPMIDTFRVMECDVLRAPQGMMDKYSGILATILGTLIQDGRWTQQVSYEYWKGQYNDRITYFSGSFFGEDEFSFYDAGGQGYQNFDLSYAWQRESGGEFVLTDAADFDPNGRVGTQRWIRLKPVAGQ
jgi:hypothetical protein